MTKNFFFAKFECGRQDNAEFCTDFETVERRILRVWNTRTKFWGHWVHIWVDVRTSRMQISKKWINQLKNFFNKTFWEYYLASFAGESHQVVKVAVTYCIQKRGTSDLSLNLGGFKVLLAQLNV